MQDDLMPIFWEKKSNRLWVAEVNGRHFRIEKRNSQAHGGYLAREIDSPRTNRTIQQEPTTGQAPAKKVVEDWLNGVGQAQRPVADRDTGRTQFPN